MAAVLCLCLAGCAAVPPERAEDGTYWSLDWVSIGTVLGVDAPEGWMLRENDQTRAAEGMLYATWSMGEGEDYANQKGEPAVLYDAQINVLIIGAPSPKSAANAIEEWMDLANTHYAVDGDTEQTYNGQTFTVLAYAYCAGDNPYDRGAAAYGVYRNYAVNVELSCRETFTGDASELLGEFLECCHYGR